MAKFDLKEYIENNRQQAMIYGGVGVVLVLLLIVGLLKVTGVIGGGSDEVAANPDATSTGFGSTAGGPPGAPGMSPRGPMPGGPMPGGPMASPAMPGGPAPSTGAPTPDGAPSPGLSGNPSPSLGGSSDLSAPAGAGAKKTAKKDLGPNMFKPRIDPFAPAGMKSAAELKKMQQKWLEQQKEITLIAQMNTLPPVSIWRVKAPVVETQTTGNQPTETPVVRRVAGLLYGDRVLGVLETDGKTSVVKPGDVLTSGTERVKVTLIDREGIVLRRLDNKKPGVPTTFRVSLKGAPEGGVTTPVGPGRGMSGPGGFRGGPPMPGMPRPGGPPLPEG